MVHPFRMIISGKGEEEDIEEQGVLDWKADWLTCTKGYRLGPKGCFKHNILWRDLQVLDGHQKMDKTWKDAFPKSCSHIDEESKEDSKKLSWFGRPQENPDGPRELRNSFQLVRTGSRFKWISARPYQEIKAIKQTRIFSLFLPLGRTCGTVTVKIESHL
jgi:hypothetical protein